jgi:hypothetical protein
MGLRIGATSNASFYDHSDNLSDTYVVEGETSLRQIADKLHMDPGALAEANPQIKDGKVLPLQVINLPVCSAEPVHADQPVTVVGKPAGHELPKGPVGDPLAASLTKAKLSAAAPATAKSEIDEKVRNATAQELIGKAAAMGLGAYGMARLGTTLAGLPASEFKRQTAQIRDALNSGDKESALHAIATASAATQEINAHGGGEAVQAHVTDQPGALHFDFDRPLSKDEAAALIFQQGKVPEGAKLEQGPGNSWVVRYANDGESRQNVASHFNSHLETVGLRPSKDPAFGPERDLTFTWVRGGAHPAPPASKRRDLNNDFGFKVLKHYPLDQGQISVTQVKSWVGKGEGYEVAFDKPMTKDEVMDKLFEKSRFTAGDVKLKAVPHEPSNVWQIDVAGPDALTAFKKPYAGAIEDANVFAKESSRPGVPAGMQHYFDNKTVPPNAVKHPGNVYTWEQDGYIAYVESDGKGHYDAQSTKLAENDEVSNRTIRYFIMEKGMPPREGWQAFVQHWDDIHRTIILAFINAISLSLGHYPGRVPMGPHDSTTFTPRRVRGTGGDGGGGGGEPPRTGGTPPGGGDPGATGVFTVPANSRVNVVSPVYNIAGRDVMIVDTSVGRQAFYRSSGVNSRQPGKWLPVDEFREFDGWFNKEGYVHGPGRERGEPLHRVGTEEFARISDDLDRMNIPPGMEAPPGITENARMTMNRILDFFGARITPTTRQRPVGE